MGTSQPGHSGSADIPQKTNLGLFRIALPSLCDFVFVLLLISLTTGSVPKRLLGDADIGWHIRNGEDILRTHSIPRMDSFSSTMSGQPWYAWEWMYDAGIAAIHHWAGLNGVVFFTALVIAVTYTSLLQWMIFHDVGAPVAVPLLLLSIASSTIHFLARPHVLSWMFALFWLHLLESWRTSQSPTRNRRLWLLPLSMLFWVNLHGGFLTGLVILGIYLTAGFWHAALIHWGKRVDLAGFNAWDEDEFRSLVAVFAASSLATLVNPYGYKLHIHIYRYLSDRFLIDNIQEFQSPNFHGAGPRCFAVMLLIAIVVLAATRRRLPLVHLLLVLFSAYSGVYSSRNLPLAAILLATAIGPVLSSLIDEHAAQSKAGVWVRMQALGSRLHRLESGFRGHLWPIAILLAGLVVCARGGSLGSQPIMHAAFDSARFPVNAVQFISDRGIHDPIFCSDAWGGYVIYRLYPANRVVIDDRHDFYGDAFLKDYLKIVHTEPGWTELLRQKNVKWVLVPAQSSLAGALRVLPHASLLYQDETTVLFRLR